MTKIRHRYITFTILSKEDLIFHRKDIINSIQQHCKKKYHTGCKAYGFYLTRFQNNTGIFRCYHTEKDRAISFLQSLDTINKTSVSIETLGTSGTIKTLIRKYLKGERLLNP